MAKRKAVVLIDGCSIVNYRRRLLSTEHKLGARIDYSALFAKIREMLSSEAANYDVVFSMLNAIDGASKGQQLFLRAMEQLGCNLSAVDYRDTYVGERKLATQSLATLMAYTLGTLTSRKPIVYVVSNAFELYHPLQCYGDATKTKVTLLFWEYLLDIRWEQKLRQNANSYLCFSSLDACSKDVLGLDLNVGKDNELLPIPKLV